MSDVLDRDLGLRAIMRQIENLKGAEVTVGIHEAEGTHEMSDQGSRSQGWKAGTTVAQIGAWHEGGTKYMPARPWLAPTIDEQRPAIDGLFDRAMGVVLDGSSPKIILAKLGTFAQQKVQAKIRDSDPNWEPLAWSTMKAKSELVRGSKASGKKAAERQEEFLGGDGNPLVDTAQFLQSIRYVVKLGD